MSLKDLRKVYGNDERLEQEGVWFSPPFLNNKISFLLARMGRTNKLWQTEVALIHQKYKAEIDAGDTNNPELLKEVLRAFCRVILRNWRGLTNDEGQEIPYTPEGGFKLLDELPDLYDKLAEVAGVKNRYQQGVNDDIVKK